MTHTVHLLGLGLALWRVINIYLKERSQLPALNGDQSVITGILNACVRSQECSRQVRLLTTVLSIGTSARIRTLTNGFGDRCATVTPH